MVDGVVMVGGVVHIQRPHVALLVNKFHPIYRTQMVLQGLCVSICGGFIRQQSTL